MDTRHEKERNQLYNERVPVEGRQNNEPTHEGYISLSIIGKN